MKCPEENMSILTTKLHETHEHSLQEEHHGTETLTPTSSLSIKICCRNSGVLLSRYNLDTCSSEYPRTSQYGMCLTSITCSLFSHHLPMEEEYVAPGLLFS